MKPVNVLFLVPSLRRGGAETQLVRIINKLPVTDFSCYLFTFHTVLEQLADVKDALAGFYNYPRRFKYDLRVARRIADIIDKERIDVVHCTLLFSLLMGWIACRLAERNPELQVAIHTTVNRALKEELQERFIYRWLLKSCPRIIFVCKKQLEHWVKRYPFLASRSTVVYNGIDTSFFDPADFANEGRILRQSLQIPENAVVSCCIAGLRPEKGHLILIEALARSVSKPYLLLAGDGPMRLEIESLVATHNLTERVKFLGTLDDIRPVLAASACSILPSGSTETFSIAMLESMAMETPVLATDLGGISEAVCTGETGYLIEPGNIEQLSTVLDEAASDLEFLSSMGQKARILVAKNYTIEKTAANTAAVLRAAWLESKTEPY